MSIHVLSEKEVEEMFPLVYKVNSPDELKKLQVNQLPEYCHQLREFLIQSIGHNSGHFASNLGTIELSTALHYVYDSPNDKIVWDVGHQAYAHKVITGRRSQIHTIRKLNGVHPFPARRESEHDILTVGHSSTSISASVGIAYANKLNNSKDQVLAVIGDGAITGGMAFEAMNHGGSIELPLGIVFNDNNMSISENVGALNNKSKRDSNQLLGKITGSSLYKDFVSKIDLERLPVQLANALKGFDTSLKGMLSNDTSHYSSLFQNLGFSYVGPIDGHSVVSMVEIFTNYRLIDKPTLFHVITVKGKGYTPAEVDPIRYHGVSNFLTEPEVSVSSLTNSDIFGRWICSRAESNPKLIAITPAMREGSGLVEFAKKFPKQYIDTAIAEQHAVTLAAGLAIAGYQPVLAIYSTFLQRGYDQVIHDIAIDNLNVTFAVDRAGLVGADGQTHQGAFDISYLRSIPNLVLTTPCSGFEIQAALDFSMDYDGPVFVRYPRANSQLEAKNLFEQQIWSLGKGIKLLDLQYNLINKGKKIAILSFGTMIQLGEVLAQKHGADLYNMRFVKPLDLEIVQAVLDYDLVVTLEENAKSGGAGSAVLEAINEFGGSAKVHIVGIPDQFIVHGSPQEIRDLIGWNESTISQAISSIIK